MTALSIPCLKFLQKTEREVSSQDEIFCLLFSKKSEKKYYYSNTFGKHSFFGISYQYRVFASGINAPGRNIFVALKLTF
jgi:hypothetical protein